MLVALADVWNARPSGDYIFYAGVLLCTWMRVIIPPPLYRLLSLLVKTKESLGEPVLSFLCSVPFVGA